MRIDSLTLVDFRNYASQQFRFSGLLHVLTGQNAQGKTNALEAIILLATGRSPRASKDVEFIRWGADMARVAAEVKREFGPVTIDVVVRPGVAKRIRVNGQPIRRLRDLFGNLNVVAFTPDDLQLVKGSPSLRRQFLDYEIAQVSSSYRDRLSRYHRALRQRNAVLRQVAEGQAPANRLEPWDAQLLEHGVPIIIKRAEMVNALSRWAQRIHRQITRGVESLVLAYEPFFATDESGEFSESPDHAMWTDPSIAARRFEEALYKMRPIELRRGVSMVGPQRDDIRFVIDGRDLRAYGSQGQQRTAVLACKLAEIAYMEEEVGEPPILLLDDVMSELDSTRRNFLVTAVQDRVQTFITSAHLGDLGEEIVKKAEVFHIRSGRAERVKQQNTSTNNGPMR